MPEVKKTGILPVHENKFKIGTKGLASSPEDMKEISCMEGFSVSFDNGVEEFTPMETAGWVRRLMTAKSVSISMNGKRDIGNEGNDYVAGLMLANGQDASTKFEWILPSGVTVKFNCVANVTAVGGDSTNIDALEFEVMSDGLVTAEPAAAAAAVQTVKK